MDEIKPVAFANPQAFVNFRERGHLSGVYGREWMWAKHHPECVPLYDQQAIDTLRAEVEDSEGAARVWRRRCQEAEARAERAEAALNLLERVLGPTVPTSVTSSGTRCEWEEALKILAKAKAERT